MNTDIRISDIIDPSWLPFQVQGRSMEPTLPDKTILWYDPNDKQLVEGELYVLDLGEAWYPEVRRMMFPGFKEVLMKCDNPNYGEGYLDKFRDYNISNGAYSDILIAGRVKLSITLHDPWARRSLSRKTDCDARAPHIKRLAA